MSDPLTDIIAMSNDKEIVEEVVANKLRRKRKRRYESSHDDVNDDPDTDPETDTDDEDMNESQGGYSVTDTKSKGKVNKKLLNRELQNNKLRQISIPIPVVEPTSELINKHTLKNNTSDKYVDYNASEYVDGGPKRLPQTRLKPLYKDPVFYKHVLMGIVVILLSAWLILKLFRFVKRKYNERKASQRVLLGGAESMPESKLESKPEEETRVYSLNFDDGEIDVKKDMLSVKNEVKQSYVKQQTKMTTQKGSKNIMPRDSKGRFMKRK